MKLIFELLFALLFPLLYVAYFFIAVSYKIVKSGILYIVQEYRVAQAEFERVNGSNIS
jgi:hypothetical protein